MSDERALEFGDEDFSEEEEEEEEEEESDEESEESVSDEESEELGSENEGSEGDVESGEEMTSLPSSKRFKEIPVDRLSALPDSLLIHILSFLETRKAARTCVLSKRWQFVWTELPSLEFCTYYCKNQQKRKHMSVSMVHEALANHSGNNLERFMVDVYYYETLASDVDVWVEFVVRKMVKEVVLIMSYNGGEFGDGYKLPQMMYSNSSLRELHLEGCVFCPQGTIDWRSLTKLFLDSVEIRHCYIEKILSGCPVLDSLSLIKCDGFSSLDIHSQSVRTLVVEDWDPESEASLEISAPYVKSLDISAYLEGKKFRLRNLRSILTAIFEFGGGDWDDSFPELVSYAKEVFVGLQHIRKIELGSGAIKVLAMLAATGWQFPQSRRECLKVEARKDEESISTILALLESSPNLETLVIKGYCIFWERVRCHPPPAKGDLNCDLLHLKTIIFTGFADELDGEPMLKLAKILLTRAIVLEKMVINEFMLSSRNSSRDYIKIAQTLLSYPRSSQKAIVLLKDVSSVL